MVAIVALAIPARTPLGLLVAHRRRLPRWRIGSAVTFVIGNAHRVSTSLFAPGTTISATIANEFTEAVGDLYTSSLIALGLILFVITFIVLALARVLIGRQQHA